MSQLHLIMLHKYPRPFSEDPWTVDLSYKCNLKLSFIVHGQPSAFITPSRSRSAK
jgi:hypothetical protein